MTFGGGSADLWVWCWQAGSRSEVVRSRYYVAGLRAAHSADDRPLGAHILGSMAYQAAREGPPKEAGIIRLMDHFTTLLQAVTKHPQQRVSQLVRTYPDGQRRSTPANGAPNGRDGGLTQSGRV
jgi:hypothetical protein